MQELISITTDGQGSSVVRGRESGYVKKSDVYSVRIFLRPTEKDAPTPDAPRALLVGVRIKCQHTVVLPLVDVTTTTHDRVVVTAESWNQDKQRSFADLPTNNAIDAYRRKVDEIFSRQQKQCKQLGINLTPNSLSVTYEIKYGVQPVVVGGEWVYATHVTPVWGRKKGRDFQPVPAYPQADLTKQSSITDAFTQYINQLRGRTGAIALSPTTLGRWERALVLVNAFVLHTGQPAPVAARLTVGWARRFHTWMQTDAVYQYKLLPIGPLQANRFLSKVREVLQWVYEEGFADKNPLLGVKWAKAIRQHNILFLETEQVEQLAQLELDGPLATVRWWFLLMCYTGMDYPDAVAYAQNRKSYEQLGRAGWKIVGNRKKPPCNTFYVPLLPGVLTLFEQYPEGPHAYCSNSINGYTDQIELLLGVGWRITAKTARKTFGNMMLAKDYRIADISRMMGHSTIAMTEKHYVRVSEAAIDKAMLRIQGQTLALSIEPPGQAVTRRLGH